MWLWEVNISSDEVLLHDHCHAKRLLHHGKQSILLGVSSGSVQILFYVIGCRSVTSGCLSPKAELVLHFVPWLNFFCVATTT